MGKYVNKLVLGVMDLSTALSQAESNFKTALEQIHYAASRECQGRVGMDHWRCIVGGLISKAAARRGGAGLAGF